jgi:chromosome segregation ATPase
MTEPQRKTSPLLDAIRHLHDATRELLIERDDYKAKSESSEQQLQLTERRAAIAESEAEQLRAALERMTSERDGYFQDVITLRAALTNAGNMILETTTSTTQRQAFSPPTATEDDSAERLLPQFVRQDPRKLEGRPRVQVDITTLEAALATG